MRHLTQSNRDPRLFRGDVVQCLNVLQREGKIIGYELSARERGVINVSRIFVRVSGKTGDGAAGVYRALQVIPRFAELGGEVAIEAIAD